MIACSFFTKGLLTMQLYLSSLIMPYKLLMIVVKKHVYPASISLLAAAVPQQFAIDL